MNNHQAITQSATSNEGHAYVVIPDKPEHAYVSSPAPAEHAYVADGHNAERRTLKRTTIYLDEQNLSRLAALDGQPAAWHVRRAIAAYLDRLTHPVADMASVGDMASPMSVTLTPNAHSLAVHIADRMGVDVGQLVSAAVLEQLEAMD